jgi:hypothetical protein
MKNARKAAIMCGKITSFLIIFSIFVIEGKPIGYINLGEWYDGNTNTYGNLTSYLFNTTSSFQQVTVYLIGPSSNYVVQMYVLPYPSESSTLLEKLSDGLDAVAIAMACPGDVLRGTYEVQIYSNLAGSPYRFQITEQGRFYFSHTRLIIKNF